MNKRFITIIMLSLAVCMLSIMPTDGADYTLVAPSIQIISPRANAYRNNTINVEIVATALIGSPEIVNIYYSLDPHNPLAYNHTNFTKNTELVTFAENKTGYVYYGRAVIENLSEGNYTLRAIVDTGKWGQSGSTVNFRVVDKDYQPAVLLSPNNQTYYSSNVPLVFSTNENYVYAYYCLNGGKPIFVNKTSSILNGLPEGSNSLLLFVKFKDIFSDFNVGFTINSAGTDNSSIATNLIIIGVIIAIAILLGAIFAGKRKFANKQF